MPAWKLSKPATTANFNSTLRRTSIGLRAPGYARMTVPAGDEMRVPLSSQRIRGLYMSFWAVSSQTMRAQIFETAAKAHLNAIVIDVKGDLGLVAIRTSIPLVAKDGANRVITIPDAPALIAGLHQRGLYAIARIVTFKDSPLATARPDLAVKTADGSLFADNEHLHWTDPFKQAVWDYNIQIAVAAAKAGFDEVEFDYVRFPDHPGLQFSKENNEANRRGPFPAFLAEAQKALNPYNVFLSADIFGYVAWNLNDTGIGQDFTDVGKVVDYISLMLYPSGFRYGIPGRAQSAGRSLPHRSRSRLKKRSSAPDFPARQFRPWLQAFADYAFDHRQFGKTQLHEQIKAAEDAGAQGWLLWNPRNTYPTQTLAELASELWWKEPIQAARR